VLVCRVDDGSWVGQGSTLLICGQLVRSCACIPTPHEFPSPILRNTRGKFAVGYMEHSGCRLSAVSMFPGGLRFTFQSNYPFRGVLPSVVAAEKTLPPPS